MAIAALALLVDLGMWGGHNALRWGGSVSVSVVVAAGVVCYSTLVWRRAHPLIVFAVVWIYAVACGSALPNYQSFAGLLLMVYYLARHLPLRRAAPVAGTVVIPFGLNVANSMVLTSPNAGVMIGVTAVWVGLTTFFWLIGRLGARAEQTAALREQHRVAQVALTAQNERLRLARELHDSVASSIISVAMQAGGARHRARLQASLVPGAADAANAGPDISDTLAAIETASTEAMRELRRLLGLLHSEDGVEEIGHGARLAEIDPLVAQARAVGVELELDERGTRVPLDRSVDHTAYRVVQEALTNIAKHAGTGARGRVTIAWSPATVRVEVCNTLGKVASPQPAPSGVESAGHHLGLAGLRERARSCGGTVEWAPQPDGGFALRAELPCGVGATP